MQILGENSTQLKEKSNLSPIWLIYLKIKYNNNKTWEIILIAFTIILL